MNTVTFAIQAPVIRKVIADYFEGTPAFDADYAEDLAPKILTALAEVGEIKNIILSELLYEGDRVVMNMNKEARGWGRKGVPDGTIGTIRDVYRFKDYYTRYNGNTHHAPGVYETDGVRYVEWDNFVLPEGEKLEDYNRADASDVTLLDQGLRRQRYENDWRNSPLDYGARNMVMNHVVRIGDLPETKFYELDKVRVTHPTFKEETGYVHHINYHRTHDKLGSSYDIQMDGGGSTWLHDVDLELIERGNVWRHYHNEPTVFASLEEEVTFHTGMGWTEQLRNPATGDYRWTQDEVLEALRVGDAHALRLVGGLFGGAKMDAAFKFQDLDLGERVRLRTLEEFGLQSA